MVSALASLAFSITPNAIKRKLIKHVPLTRSPFSAKSTTAPVGQAYGRRNEKGANYAPFGESAKF